MVKSCFCSPQPSRVSCRKCNENPKPQKQCFESSKKSETSSEKAKHSIISMRALLTFRATGFQVLDKVQYTQEFTGTCMVTPGHVLQQIVNGTYLLGILICLSPGKCFIYLSTGFFFVCVANDLSFSYLWTFGLRGVWDFFLTPLANPQGIWRLAISYSFVPREVFWWTSKNTRTFTQYHIHKEIWAGEGREGGEGMIFGLKSSNLLTIM